ncbi:hypothetical protein AM493_16895 [Flavobacterium akiainvivens]|uniref:Uncharacterized protein n=2 Tax=Flavobacterium akiainvivens TaxID=1202724 RepID=A0A0M8MF11_9FLAO|nr:hypothetical protein AM493_16895 [Flavobacterium akiainvivens]
MLKVLNSIEILILMNDTLQKALIRIDQLQHQVDSLKNSHTIQKINYEAVEKMDVVEKVNAFYDSSWNKMLWVMGIFVTLVGIALPLVIQWMQQRSFKRVTDEIVGNATAKFNTRVQELGLEHSNKIDELNNSFETQINQLSNSNSEELQVLNNTFSDITKNIQQQLETGIEDLKKTAESAYWNAEANLYSILSVKAEEAGRKFDACFYAISTFLADDAAGNVARAENGIEFVVATIKELDVEELVEKKDELIHANFSEFNFTRLFEELIKEANPRYLPHLNALQQYCGSIGIVISV